MHLSVNYSPGDNYYNAVASIASGATSCPSSASTAASTYGAVSAATTNARV